MSRFYKKYLNGLPSGGGGDEENSKKIDPTSMSLSKTNATSSAKGDLQPQRRVQIVNKSDNFNPNAGAQDLQTYAKPEASKTFLRNALSDHYLFTELGETDMSRIVD